MRINCLAMAVDFAASMVYLVVDPSLSFVGYLMPSFPFLILRASTMDSRRIKWSSSITFIRRKAKVDHRERKNSRGDRAQHG